MWFNITVCQIKIKSLWFILGLYWRFFLQNIFFFYVPQNSNKWEIMFSIQKVDYFRRKRQISYFVFSWTQYKHSHFNSSGVNTSLLSLHPVHLKSDPNCLFSNPTRSRTELSGPNGLRRIVWGELSGGELSFQCFFPRRITIWTGPNCLGSELSVDRINSFFTRSLATHISRVPTSV